MKKTLFGMLMAALLGFGVSGLEAKPKAGKHVKLDAKHKGGKRAHAKPTAVKKDAGKKNHWHHGGKHHGGKHHGKN